MIIGSLVALVTPMYEDGAIDWQSFDALIEMHIAAGTTAIVAVGTTGESATLAVLEHGEVISRAVRQAAGRVPVIAGTGANSTAEAIELTRSARGAGADACLLVTPYYNKPTQEGLYRHHVAVAEAVDIPQMLYNVPGRTGVDMLPQTVARLVDVDNIVAIKEATGDLNRAREVLAVCAGKIAVYSGDDATATELMLLGGQGSISVTANVAPALLAQVCQLAVAGDEAAARSLDARLQPLHDALFLESNPIPVKWALQRQGLIPGGLRLPMTPLDAQHHAAVESAMAAAGVL
jgi:4-hydroxy-tetrahydrodipicolinate synthase